MKGFGKRTGCLLLTALLAVGCTTTPQPAAAPQANSDAADTLIFPLIVSGSAPQNLQAVETALNEYVSDRLDVQIEFTTVDIATLEDFYLLQSSSNQQVDFISLMPGAALLPAMVDAGLVLPLDELLAQYGEGVRQAASGVLAAGQLNGVQYMLPQVKDTCTMGTSLEFNAALVQKYDIDITAIHSLDELEPLLALMLEKEPQVVPFSSSGAATGYTQLLSGYDNLIDTLGVLDLQASDELTVVDWYETEGFAALAERMHRWYQLGYIGRDALICQENGTARQEAGEVFCTISTIMPTGDQGTDPTNTDSGIVEVQLPGQPQLLTSYQAGLEGVCISSSCKAPEKAMQFLNLLYTDEYLTDLLQYGVEGQNYTINEQGLVDTGGKYFLLYSQPGNQTLRRHSTEDGVNYAEREAAYKQNDVRSPAFGFVFDPSSVSREVSLCRAVVAKYYAPIDCGSVDPATEIPAFVAELKKAGIDKIVAEKQRQLDEWSRQQD